MGLSRGREMDSLLMQASIPIIPIFSWISVFFIFFFWHFFFLVLPLFLAMVSPPLHCSQLWPFILPVVTGFTIFTPQPLLAHCGRPSKTTHWPTFYLATTITLCWQHYASFRNKNGLSCLLALFVLTNLIG